MAAPISKRCFSTLRGDRGPSWNRSREGPRVFRRSGLGDAPALSLSAAQLVAAHPGADLLADLADADLGFYEPVSLQQQQLCLPRFWRAARRGHVVGRLVPRPARPDDVVSRGNVGPQSRASICDAAASLRMGAVIAVDEH